jgi:hypothetical protein
MPWPVRHRAYPPLELRCARLHRKYLNVPKCTPFAPHMCSPFNKIHLSAQVILMRSILSFFETHRRALTWSPKCLPRKALVWYTEEPLTRRMRCGSFYGLGQLESELSARLDAEPWCARGSQCATESYSAAPAVHLPNCLVLVYEHKSFSRGGALARPEGYINRLLYDQSEMCYVLPELSNSHLSRINARLVHNHRANEACRCVN